LVYKASFRLARAIYSDHVKKGERERERERERGREREREREILGRTQQIGFYLFPECDLSMQ
jgi:hypothetical protein